MKKLLLAGLFLLVPLAALGIIFAKLFEFALRVTGPARRILPHETIGELAIANILAVMAILALLILAGLAARMTSLSGRLDRFDRFVVAAIPTYAVAKVALGTAARGAQGEPGMKPVLVRFDDYSQIAFEIERDDTHAMLFLPGSPTVFSGASVRVDVERVTILEIPFNRAVGVLQMLGKGGLGLYAGARNHQ